MGLKEEFEGLEDKDNRERYDKESPYELHYHRADSPYLAPTGPLSHYYYNFFTRVLLVKVKDSATAIPFSQLDRESLELMRDKLIELGGQPPELPKEPVYADAGLEHDIRAPRTLKLK